MGTGQVVLKEPKEFMKGRPRVYQPLYPSFMGNTQQYAVEVAKREFRRLEAIGDLRGKRVTPKDTEIKALQVREGSKFFKAYFNLAMLPLSGLQSQEGIEDANNMILEEYEKSQDELMLFGDGTSNSNMLNNGLFYSADPNYIHKNSTAVPVDDDVNYLNGLHTKVMETVDVVDGIAGKKIVLFYGDLIRPLFNAVYPGSSMPFKEVLQKVLGDQYGLRSLPSDLTPSGANGWLIANVNQVRTHFTTLPSLDDQGYDAKAKEYWFHFLQGSMMVEVLAEGGIIRQPATLASP